MLHSTVVGGSTAKRVINCPGSVALSAKMPAQPESTYAATGTLLHNVISYCLDKYQPPEDFLGVRHNDIELTPELIEDKLKPALEALNDIDPDNEMDYAVETKVSFGDIIPGAFGSTDLLGRLGDRAVVLDWKFGDGVVVEAEENPQLMYYAAAALRTPEVQWVFEGAKEIECIIVQPPFVKRWVTSFDRIRQFERELVLAVRLAASEDAPLHIGDHCRWCQAKPICPQMNSSADRALLQDLKSLDVQYVSAALSKADQLEAWITDLRVLALQMLERGVTVPGYKLVAKRGSRKWRDEEEAKKALLSQLPENEVVEHILISPAQAEKKIKKVKGVLPDTVSISSGSTLVPESDPRPPMLQ
ncbi:MAG: DUF2800 domain-containing protein, partial [Saprospiraceae bacterium]